MGGPIVEGEVLAGKYRVERIIGQGGMGVVLSAIHLHLHQRIAIKLLLTAATAEAVERFLREARAAVRLKSEHVARVLDVGALESGAPYMVMEYLEGQDLSQVLQQRGPLPIEEAVEYVLHASEAIAEAHAIGIVHRDLKPANLFLTSAADGTGTVKVLDFGISKAIGEPQGGGAGPQMALTKTEMVLGSPLYMSPEQMRSARTVDARADIWSMGAILYQLITGRVPFDTTSLTELVLMINTEQPPRPSAFRPDLPPALEAAILRCLEKRCEDRFASISELAEAIAPFGSVDAPGSVVKIQRMLGVAQPLRNPPSRMPSRPSMAAVAASAANPASGSGSANPASGSGSVNPASAPGSANPASAPEAARESGAVGPYEMTRPQRLSSQEEEAPRPTLQSAQGSATPAVARPFTPSLNAVVARTSQAQGELQAGSGSMPPGPAPIAQTMGEPPRQSSATKALVGVGAVVLLMGAAALAVLGLRSRPLVEPSTFAAPVAPQDPSPVAPQDPSPVAPTPLPSSTASDPVITPTTAALSAVPSTAPSTPTMRSSVAPSAKPPHPSPPQTATPASTPAPSDDPFKKLRDKGLQ